jgi:hypothetical protein
MPYPGSKHALLRFPATGLHGYRTITEFFVRTLRPETAAPTGTAGTAP